MRPRVRVDSESQFRQFFFSQQILFGPVCIQGCSCVPCVWLLSLLSQTFRLWPSIVNFKAIRPRANIHRGSWLPLQRRWLRDYSVAVLQASPDLVRLYVLRIYTNKQYCTIHLLFKKIIWQMNITISIRKNLNDCSLLCIFNEKSFVLCKNYFLFEKENYSIWTTHHNINHLVTYYDYLFLICNYRNWH